MAEAPLESPSSEKPRVAPARGPFSYIVAILVLGAVGAYAAYDYFVVTERKKVLATIENLRWAVLSKDIQKIHDLLTRDCRLTRGTIAEVNDEWIRAGLLHYSPSSIRITKLKLDIFQTLAKGNFVAEAQMIRRAGGPKGYRFPVSMEFRLEEKRWKVSSVVVKPSQIEEW